MIEAYVAGVGLLAPGLPGWSASRPILVGREPYVPGDLPKPAGACLPATERRRATSVTRLALDVATEALGGVDPGRIASVFASSGGEVDVIHGIFDQLAGIDRRLSPTAFHNSVHNAASGYWSIATGSHQPTDSICAFDGSFASGLTEALLRCIAEGLDVLLVAYDSPPPFPIAEFRSLIAPFGVALLLRAGPGAAVCARLRAEWRAAPGMETTLTDPALERLRLGNPAARSLPLLAPLAAGGTGRLTIGDGMGGSLDLEVAPWS